MKVARELIQQNDKRQRAFRRLAPSLKTPGACLLMQRAPSLSDFGVQFFVLAELFFDVQREPEIQNLSSLFWAFALAAQSLIIPRAIS